MSTETGDKISRVYGSFRGVDFRGEEISINRSPDSLNVWKDYTETESIRTRPGMKLNTAFSDTVYGIFFYDGAMLVHSGSVLYKVKNGTKTTLYTGLNKNRSDSFVYDNIWYFKDGKNYLAYNGTTIAPVVGYIPTTSIGRKPESGGEISQDVNLLSPYKINTFLADGGWVDKPTGETDEDGNEITEQVWEGGTVFWLDADNGIDKDFTPVVEMDEDIDFTVDYDNATITFDKAPAAPDTDGQDNIKITFKKTIDEYADRILKCTLLQVFDNRVFVSGNPDYPNVVWHCSLDDPTYFSDLDYYEEGLDSSPIRGLVAGNNALWVFREPNDSNTTVFYHTPTIDSEYGKIYPSQHSSITTGCIGCALNFNDDIVFFSARGMEGISGDITTEQVAAHRSSIVDRKLIAEDEYKNMVLAEWKGYLLVIIGDKVYLADSRTAFTNEGHIEYDWFYWSLEKPVTSARVYDGVLYLGTDTGVYTLDDMSANIESYWVTPKDKFKTANKLKTTNKRGCVVEATGDISVYAEVEDKGFELIGEFTGVTDYFTVRIKRKKFKDLKLKFHSNTQFSLETATLEVFIGGYIKR